MARRRKLDEETTSLDALAEQQGRSSLEQPVQEIPVRQTPEELQAQQRAAAQAMMNAPTNTAESITKPAAAIKSGETLPSEATEQNYADRLSAAMEKDPVRATIADAYRQQDKSFADYLQGIKDDYERKRQEAQAQVKAAQDAAKYTGFAELGASLANLIGVGGANAVSQQYKTFSQDWMQNADRDMREHRNGLENLRERQRETELKMAQLRQQGGLALAQYDANRRQQIIENALAQQKAELDARLKAGELTVKQYEAETKRMQAQASADYNAGRLKNDEMRARASAASSYASAKYNNARTEDLKKNGGRGGSGSSSDLSITFDEYDNIPGETLKIKDQSLLRTIEANVDGFSDADREAVQDILDGDGNADEKAKRLIPYIKRNQRMRDLVRRSATSSTKFGGGSAPKTEEVAEDEDGFIKF